MTSAMSTAAPTASAIHSGRVERRANGGTSNSVESTRPARFAGPANAALRGSQDGRNAVASCSRSSCAASLGISSSPPPGLNDCPLTMTHERTIGPWGEPFRGDESEPHDAGSRGNDELAEPRKPSVSFVEMDARVLNCQGFSGTKGRRPRGSPWEVGSERRPVAWCGPLPESSMTMPDSTKISIGPGWLNFLSVDGSRLRQLNSD
jgi:hypothetical protein